MLTSGSCPDSLPRQLRLAGVSSEINLGCLINFLPLHIEVLCSLRVEVWCFHCFCRILALSLPRRF